MKLIQNIEGDGTNFFHNPIYDDSLYIVTTKRKIFKWNKNSRQLEFFFDPLSEEYQKQRFDICYIRDERLVFQNVLFEKGMDWATYYIFNKNGQLEDEVNLKMMLWTPYCAVKNSIVFTGSEQTLYAYNPFEKKFLWEKPNDGSSPFYIFKNYAVFHTRTQGDISLYDYFTGQEYWSIDLSSYLRKTTMGDREEIMNNGMYYHAQTNQLVIRTSFGFMITINPETGQINWAKQVLRSGLFIDPHSDIFYPMETSAFNRSDTRKYDAKFYTCNIKTGEELTLLREYTPEMFGLKGNDHALLMNIGYLNVAGSTEQSLFFTMSNLGLIFQIDKATGEIIDKYSVPKNGLQGVSFIHDNHLFIGTGKGGKNPYSLLVFDTSMPEKESVKTLY